MGTIVLAFILFCGTLVLGGSLGSADLKQKIESGQVPVHVEQVTVEQVTVGDD